MSPKVAGFGEGAPKPTRPSPKTQHIAAAAPKLQHYGERARFGAGAPKHNTTEPQNTTRRFWGRGPQAPTLWRKCFVLGPGPQNTTRPSPKTQHDSNIYNGEILDSF